MLIVAFAVSALLTLPRRWASSALLPSYRLALPPPDGVRFQHPTHPPTHADAGLPQLSCQRLAHPAPTQWGPMSACLAELRPATGYNSLRL